MSITINIYYSGNEGCAQAFAREMINSGIVKRIRETSGNLRYEYFFPMEVPNTVLLIDQWDSQEALDLHHASDVMSRIITLREKYDLHMHVERYVADTTDASGDHRFIRK